MTILIASIAAPAGLAVGALVGAMVAVGALVGAVVAAGALVGAMVAVGALVGAVVAVGALVGAMVAVGALVGAAGGLVGICTAGMLAHDASSEMNSAPREVSAARRTVVGCLNI